MKIKLVKYAIGIIILLNVLNCYSISVQERFEVFCKRQMTCNIDYCQDEASTLDNNVKLFKKLIPPDASVGYLGYQFHSKKIEESYNKRFKFVQYSLIPNKLEEAAHQDYIICDFYSKDPLRIVKIKNYDLIRQSDYRMMLFKRRK
jgi:hypothetical protein